MSDWDVVVVGAGMVGSAAGRHLAENGCTVAIIGPGEPENPNTADVFASHYDQGRVQRLIGFDPLWTRLCVESATAWPNLQQRTGITLHDPVGCLYLAPHRDSYLLGAADIGRQFGLSYQVIAGAADVHRVAPSLMVPDDVVGLFEAGPGGSINPRAVVAAQLAAAELAGGAILRDIVTSATRSGGVTELTTAAGEVHRTATVVLAAGSFSNSSGLLRRPLDVLVKGETVVLAEVSADTAASLADLPSVLYEVETDELDGIYLIKPLQYPDGRFYLKLGMNQAIDPLLADADAIRDWFRGLVPDDSLPRLRREVTTLFPDVPFRGFRTKRCILSRTISRRPYLGQVGDGWVVAMGCNGYSAMASDAQGRIAATLALTGQVPDGYDPAELTVRWHGSEPAG